MSKQSKQSKRCTICEVRPATAESPEGRLCKPCLAFADWENVHSDYDHKGARARGEKVDGAEYQLSECWVCHPELDESAEDYTPRTGTSRKGMRMTVTARANARDKAKQVAQQLPASYATGISTRNGIVTLKASKSLGEGFVLCWDAQTGRFLYGQSKFYFGDPRKPRKVRNAAAAIRQASAA